MNLLILIFTFSTLSYSQQNTSQAAKDLNIIEGEYILKSGSSSFCSAGGPVGWVRTEKAGKDVDHYMLMLGTKFIFVDINKPESKLAFPDCAYTTKTETKRSGDTGVLIENENRDCGTSSEHVRRTVQVNKDKITLTVRSQTESQGKKTTDTSDCTFELKRASREQQSLPQ